VITGGFGERLVQSVASVGPMLEKAIGIEMGLEDLALGCLPLEPFRLADLHPGTHFDPASLRNEAPRSHLFM
jgi:hypothetical protein